MRFYLNIRNSTGKYTNFVKVNTSFLFKLAGVIVKRLLKSALNYLHLDVTRNLKYDRYTKQIMKRVLKKDSNCIDVGCHKGELLDVITRLAPQGKHYAFEPIPTLYEQLCARYGSKVHLYPFALSDSNGVSAFQYVKNDPAYSGIKKRLYNTRTPDIDEISVDIRTLDKVIPQDLDIDFIKIDVEGGEFGVLKGGVNLIHRCKPIIIFESGLGASEYYGTAPEDVYDFLTQTLGMNISLLKSFANKGGILDREEYLKHYHTRKEFYFIAHT